MTDAENRELHSNVAVLKSQMDTMASDVSEIKGLMREVINGSQTRRQETDKRINSLNERVAKLEAVDSQVDMVELSNKVATAVATQKRFLTWKWCLLSSFGSASVAAGGTHGLHQLM